MTLEQFMTLVKMEITVYYAHESLPWDPKQVSSYFA